MDMEPTPPDGEAEAEPEADPALLYTTSNVVAAPAVTYAHSPLVRAVLPAATTTYTHAATPVVHTAPVTTTYTHTPVVHTAAVKTVAATPAVTYTHTPVVHTGLRTVASPLVYNHNLALTHPVTSINNVPVVQTAAAAAVHTVAKREAEAEADPALLYTTGVHTPLTYATVNHAAVAAPLTTTYHAAPVATHVAAPVTYVNKAVVTAPVAKAVSPVVQ